MIADLRANRAPILPNAVFQRAVAPASLASHYELCKARMHELDYHPLLDRKGRYHLAREMRRRAAELLATYIDMEPIQRAAVNELFYPLAKRKTVAPLLLHEVVALFDELDIILGSAFTELLFILGCATAVRNVIFRLQTRCFRLLLIRSAATFNPGDTRPLDAMTQQQRTLLETNYRLLSDIIHAQQSESENHFFHGSHFHRRFSTVRWEVVNLALAYLPSCAELRANDDDD